MPAPWRGGQLCIADHAADASPSSVPLGSKTRAQIRSRPREARGLPSTVRRNRTYHWSLLYWDIVSGVSGVSGFAVMSWNLTGGGRSHGG
jgi:hypothetical protein